MIGMKIIRKVADLTQWASDARSAGKTIGLVPTMGALHEGHLSLVERARKENDAVVVSVFVNPTQFNNPTDLATYPRSEEADFRLLEQAGVDAVFAPTPEEVYSDGADTHVYDLGPAAEVMEGPRRPGHFQGVAQIVSRLFRWTGADRGYFGEKDFQQIAVIRAMVKSEGIDIEIVACPIKRADDGLALSSRNALLSKEQRAIAPGIYAALNYGRAYSATHSVQATHDTVTERIDAMHECKTEYFEIVDGHTLQPVAEWTDSDFIVGCITVQCGPVRLIDNITFRN